MVDDFVMDAAGERPAPMNIDDAVRFTLPGVLAHQSASLGGSTLEIPLFPL